MSLRFPQQVAVFLKWRIITEDAGPEAVNFVLHSSFPVLTELNQTDLLFVAFVFCHHEAVIYDIDFSIVEI